jgi:hypothetical protein
MYDIQETNTMLIFKEKFLGSWLNIISLSIFPIISNKISPCYYSSTKILYMYLHKK